MRGLGASAGMALLCGIGVAFHVGFFALASLPMLTGILSFLSLVLANAVAGPRRFPQRIAVEGRSIQLLARTPRAIALDEIVQGWREDPDLIHLALKNGDVLVMKVASAAEGDRLLRAAGVTAAERVLRVPLASASSRIPGGSVFGGVLLALFGTGLFMALAALTFIARAVMSTVSTVDIGVFSIAVTAASLLAFGVYAVVSALQLREVVVGTDGVAYKKTFRTEFIPYGSLASVEQDTRGVRLVRKDGRRVLLPTRSAADRPLPLAPRMAPPKTPAEAQRRVLFERINAAMAAGRTPALAQVAIDRLDRHGRSREAWRDDLGKLLAPHGDYRSALVSPEDLGTLIEDSSAPADRRVAAAVALSARAGDEARRRVRIAVQACADDDLRGALEAAAEGEIEEAALGRAMSRRA
jgi:hypothetical protein